MPEGFFVTESCMIRDLGNTDFGPLLKKNIVINKPYSTMKCKYISKVFKDADNSRPFLAETPIYLSLDNVLI